MRVSGSSTRADSLQNDVPAPDAHPSSTSSWKRRVKVVFTTPATQIGFFIQSQEPQQRVRMLPLDPRKPRAREVKQRHHANPHRANHTQPVPIRLPIRRIVQKEPAV